jgi:hypothetical protein
MTGPVNTENSAKANFRATWILCLALVAGASVFAIIIVVMNQVTGPVMPADGQEYNMIFVGVAAVAALLCLLRAVPGYKKGITAIKDSTAQLNDKLNQYRAVMILYMALCEGPALFSIIVFFLTGEYIVLGITGVMLIAMLMRMPQKKKIANELALNYQEQQELE